MGHAAGGAGYILRISRLLTLISDLPGATSTENSQDHIVCNLDLAQPLPNPHQPSIFLRVQLPIPFEQRSPDTTGFLKSKDNMSEQLASALNSLDAFVRIVKTIAEVSSCFEIVDIATLMRNGYRRCILLRRQLGRSYPLSTGYEVIIVTGGDTAHITPQTVGPGAARSR